MGGGLDAQEALFCKCWDLVQHVVQASDGSDGLAVCRRDGLGGWDGTNRSQLARHTVTRASHQQRYTRSGNGVYWAYSATPPLSSLSFVGNFYLPLADPDYSIGS